MKAEQRVMLPATRAVCMLMQLGSEHRETSGGTAGSSCGHRPVTIERSAGFNTGVVLDVVSNSSRGHRLGKISNRAIGGEQ